MRSLGRVSALAGLAALAALAAACAEPALRVGTEAKYPPFESVRADGALEGLDIDLARALGRRLGREVIFRDMAFDALIPELQAGRIDLVCSAVSRTEERAKVVDFSEPYARVPMGVLLSRTRAGAVRSLDELDIPDVRIAVQRGTSGETKARSALPRARVVPFDTEVDAANEVAAGRLHAMVYDLVSVAKWAAMRPDTTRILDVELGDEHYCVVLPKGSPLLAVANAFVVEASAPGGELDAIVARWLPSPERFRVRR